MPRKPGIDVPGRGVDEQADPAQRAAALEPRHEVVRQLHPLGGLAEHELAGMEDERLVVGDRQQLGQVRLRRPRVDEGVAVVAEHPEAAVEVEVDRRGLEVRRVVRVDPDPARLELRADVPIGEDAHVVRFPFLRVVVPCSAISESTSRLRSSRSSKLWYTDANRM